MQPRARVGGRVPAVAACAVRDDGVDQRLGPLASRLSGHFGDVCGCAAPQGHEVDVRRSGDEHLANRLPDALQRCRARVERRQRRHERDDRATGRAEQDVFLGREVAEQGAHRDVRRRSDVLEGDLVEAELGEQPESDQLVLRQQRLASTIPTGFCFADRHARDPATASPPRVSPDPAPGFNPALRLGKSPGWHGFSTQRAR